MNSKIYEEQLSDQKEISQALKAPKAKLKDKLAEVSYFLEKITTKKIISSIKSSGTLLTILILLIKIYTLLNFISLNVLNLFKLKILSY